jgi:hypothetical protein
MNHSTKHFTTYDLNLATTLHSLGCQIEKIERKGNKGLFYFKESQFLDNYLDDYFKDRTLVSPQSLFNSLKFIKNRLYSNWEDRG